MDLSLRLVSSVCALLLSTSVAAAQSTQQPANPSSGARRTLLAVFAHPDDEATVSPVLAKYAAEGDGPPRHCDGWPTGGDPARRHR